MSERKDAGFHIMLGFLEAVKLQVKIEIHDADPVDFRHLPDISFTYAGGKGRCCVMFDDDEFDRLNKGTMSDKELFDKGAIAGTIIMDDPIAAAELKRIKELTSEST